MLELKSWDEVKAEQIVEVTEDKKTITQIFEKSLDESIVKVVELDKYKIVEDIMSGLTESKEVYTEVKISENKNSIRVKDADGQEYSIYIDCY